MLKKLLFTAVFTVGATGLASAVPITGSFSLTSFGGSYVDGTAPTATTATGLDFGAVFGNAGNGYGINGSALVGNATGSFASLNGTTASIADISLGTTANPYTANPFVSFLNSALALNFSNASYTRSTLGTSVTITGVGTFTDGIAADTSTGMFSLATSSQNGMANNVNFTFTSNASVTSVPEPASLLLLATPLALAGLVRMRRRRNADLA